MISNEEFIKLKNAYIELGKLIQKYGYGHFNGVLNLLMGQIRCIDSDVNDDEKISYLVESYNRLFTSGSGLTDFVIYDKDQDTRIQLNEKYNEEIKNVCDIMKRYI